MRFPRSWGRILWTVFGLVIAAQLGLYPAWFISFAGTAADRWRWKTDARQTLGNYSTDTDTKRNIGAEDGWEVQLDSRAVEKLLAEGQSGGRGRGQGTGGKGEEEQGEVKEGQGEKEAGGRLGERTREEMLKGPRGEGDCATVEELGRVSAGEEKEVVGASLAVRKMIEAHFAEHGASVVQNLPAEEFCRRGFVVGNMERAGLGNNLYKLLTAVGLAVMLNRSLVISEHGGLAHKPRSKSAMRFPFGDYIAHTEEAFNVRQLKVLWLRHGCESKFGRRFEMRTDFFLKPALSRSLCDDWTAWEHPLILYKDAEDFAGIQMFQKSRNVGMRERVRALVGSSDDDRRRPNLFGELLRFALRPTQAVTEAVEWTLGPGGDPDIAIHLRMRSRKTRLDIYTAGISCMRKALDSARWHARAGGRKLRVVLVSDSHETVVAVSKLLIPEFEVINFNFREWMRSMPDHPVMNNYTYLAPPFRTEDWGALPRWVAVVDFFLASRARIALVSSGARVTTTFSQLAAALAAANTLDEHTGRMPFRIYSSFAAALLVNGLERQRGRSMVWQPYSGNVSCLSQPDQCALTPLLPFTWWDLPWQSPSPILVELWREAGLPVPDSGEVTEETVQQFCRTNSEAEVTVEALPLDWPIIVQEAAL